MIQINGDKFLVTGGAGFIGSHICEELVKQGKQVVCLDDMRAGKEENLAPWWDSRLCTFVKADIKDPNTYQPYLKGVRVIFHEAASKCTVCRDNPIEDLLVNAWGTWCLCESARREGITKIVHASTGSVNNGQPKSFYGVSKQAGESYYRAFREYYPVGFVYTVLRYYHVYGPRQDDSDKGGVIPIFIRQTLQGGPMTIEGSGNQVRHFTHVKDVVSANFFCAKNRRTDMQTYDVVSDVTVSINQLASMIEGPVVHGPARKGDIATFQTDNKPLKALGFEFRHDFEKGLKDVISWYSEKYNKSRAVSQAG